MSDVRDGIPPSSVRSTDFVATGELAHLIADQARDAASFRVSSYSLDQFPSGADIIYDRRRLTVTDSRHGSLYCYVKLLCRCARCRAVSATYARDRRAARKAAA